MSQKTTQVIEMFEEVTDREVQNHVLDYHDSEIALKVVNGKEIDTEEYQHLAFMSDWRTVEQLIEETVRAWLIEDMLKISLDKEVSLNGSDSKRKIAESNANITTDPDLEVNGENVEVIADYGSYWIENQTAEIRANKWSNMKVDTGIFAVDIENRQIIEFEKSEVKTEFIETYPPFGGKSVYSLDISDLTFEEL